MSFEDLFVRFWWLIFPLFGMIWAFVEMAQSGRRSQQAMDVIKSLVEQGKEPPAELLDIAAGGESGGLNDQQRQTPASSVVAFTAIAVGFGIASQYARSEDTQMVFFAVAAACGVAAVGFLLMALFGPRPRK